MKNFDESEFAAQISKTLNSASQQLTFRQQQRLLLARQTAIALHRHAFSHKTILCYVNHHGTENHTHFKYWLSIFVSFLILVVGLVSLQYLEQSRRVEQLADIDTALLTDELPISAYLDRGFKNFAQFDSQE